MTSIRALCAILLTFMGLQSLAQAPSGVARSRENLIVVVREAVGANRPDDAFTPAGTVKATMPDGRDIEMEVASWEYIGDIQIRFVFEGPHSTTNATPQDLLKLGLKGVDDALALALANIKRVYGEPVATPWEGGLVLVKGKSRDLDSSYFLDRSFWQGVLKQHPEGLVVSVAKWNGLLYAPLSDVNAVERLKRGVAYLHSSSGQLRISSALFLFKDGQWSVFQAPVKQ